MAVITDLLGGFANTDRPWGPGVTFNPPSTQAEFSGAEEVLFGEMNAKLTDLD